MSSSGGARSSATFYGESLLRTPRLEKLEMWGKAAGLDFARQGVELVPRAQDSRGLVARRTFREGTTVLSIPMNTFALNAETLVKCSAAVKALRPPSFDDVRRVLISLSARDPVLFQQMHLAVLLAAERMNPSSFFAPYFEFLPHPAIDDSNVMTMHKDVLNAIQLVEWDDHQKLFVTACRKIHERWAHAVGGAAKFSLNGGEQVAAASHPAAVAATINFPPVEVLYWAFRTVLSRMHLLPDRGLIPGEQGSKLNYAAFATLQHVAQNETITRRAVNSLKSLAERLKGAAPVSGGASGDYRLVPTLVPFIDMTGHLPSGNVSIEVQPRPLVGSCVELQAVAEIADGEPIGVCLNRSQSVAFTLYRFGFLPV